MIAIQVTYTVKPNFVETNRANIGAFLADFKAMQTSNFLYHIYVKEDGLTFVHLSMYENEEMQREVLATPSFIKFQQERDEQGLDGTPLVEELKHLGSSLGMIK